ncbi:MAG: hypothetical protein HOL86_06445, partial [Flavobacteriaceae bacterium]|nr:hypothetical protein [Flavobacteriaceae bacterium]
MLVLGTLQSQYDTTHYIPYLTDLTGDSTTSNLEYNDSYKGNIYGGAYLVFSTFESGVLQNESDPIDVTIYYRNSGKWKSLFSFNSLSYGQPINLTLPSLFTSKFYRYAFTGSLYNQGSEWQKTDEYGLKIVASKNIYVRVLLQQDNSKKTNDNSYGNGTSTHGAAFTSKGVARGAGTEFYTAHFYVENKGHKTQDVDFISVMSLEDGNTVIFDPGNESESGSDISDHDWVTPNNLNTV